MARLAVLASGNGSNFQAVAEKIAETNHELSCMICDRKNAYVFSRAADHGVKSFYVSYYGREKKEAEKEMAGLLIREKTDIIALAGFMRILSPSFVQKFSGRIVNIHPSLLPRHPGTRGIEDSFNSGDRELGITVHYVDSGVDTGPVILQKSFTRTGTESIEEIENKIHKLEYRHYPEVLINILDSLDRNQENLSAI